MSNDENELIIQYKSNNNSKRDRLPCLMHNKLIKLDLCYERYCRYLLSYRLRAAAVPGRKTDQCQGRARRSTPGK